MICILMLFSKFLSIYINYYKLINLKRLLNILLSNFNKLKVNINIYSYINFNKIIYFSIDNNN